MKKNAELSTRRMWAKRISITSALSIILVYAGIAIYSILDPGLPGLDIALSFYTASILGIAGVALVASLIIYFIPDKKD